MDLGPFGKKICDKIRANSCPTPAMLLVRPIPTLPPVDQLLPAGPSSCCSGHCAQLDGSTMHPTSSDLRLVTIGVDGKKINVVPTVTDAAAALPRLDALIKAGTHNEVVDFDVHLDDPSKDWTANEKLVK